MYKDTTKEIRGYSNALFDFNSCHKNTICKENVLYRITALVGQERKEGRHRRNKSILLFENSTMKLNTVHANKNVK